MHLSINMSSLQMINSDGNLHRLVTSFYHALITG